jgi:hypothetical protein
MGIMQGSLRANEMAFPGRESLLRVSSTIKSNTGETSKAIHQLQTGGVAIEAVVFSRSQILKIHNHNT